MKIIINRIRERELSTDGVIYIDGQRICDTTEATPKLLPEGTYRISIFKCIKSKRQIPLILLEGAHSPTPHKCECCAALANECEQLRLSEYDRLNYVIENAVPHPEVVALEKVLDDETRKSRQKAIGKANDAANCPKLVHGNGAFNRIDGSILVGTCRQPGVVVNSRPIFNRLYDRIEKAISRGHQVELIICNP